MRSELSNIREWIIPYWIARSICYAIEIKGCLIAHAILNGQMAISIHKTLELYFLI